MSGASEAEQEQIVQLSSNDVAEWRDIRLRALRDNSTAFDSTFEVESALDEAVWREKIQLRTDPKRCATWLARRGGLACELASCSIDDQQADRGWLESVWVDPAVRRRGIASRLIDQAVWWAERMAFVELRLCVTSNNPAARRLYEDNGFVATGASMPHPRAQELVEWEMCRRLGGN